MAHTTPRRPKRSAVSFPAPRALRGVNGLSLVMCMLVFRCLFCPEVFAAEIRIGMTAALSGPLSELGRNMLAGANAAVLAANASGGVGGNSLRMTALDDGYEPTRAAPNMRELIDRDQVIAVIGNVGTPTAIVTVPIANAKRTLLFGAYTGAAILRKSPPERYVINYRPSYAEEGRALIDTILARGIRPQEIAFFTQRDGYGDAGYEGAIAALREHGFTDVGSLVHARYTRNTLNVEEGLAQMMDARVRPRAVVMVGAYQPSAKFIRLARRELPGTLFAHVSFAGGYALLRELGRDGEGLIMTQVVPPLDADLLVVRDYLRDLARYVPDATPDFVSLEGYIIGRIFLKALATAGDAPTRESLIDAFERLEQLDVGLGIPISFDANEHQAIHQVWLTIVRNGRFVSLQTSTPRLTQKSAR